MCACCSENTKPLHLVIGVGPTIKWPILYVAFDPCPAPGSLQRRPRRRFQRWHLRRCEQRSRGTSRSCPNCPPEPQNEQVPKTKAALFDSGASQCPQWPARLSGVNLSGANRQFDDSIRDCWSAVREKKRWHPDRPGKCIACL